MVTSWRKNAFHITVKGIHRSPLNSLHIRSVKRSFDVSFVVSLNKLLNKHSSYRWFEAPWRLCDGCIAWELLFLLLLLWSLWQQFHGPLTRCAKLRVTHAPGMQGTFSSPPIPTCITARAWRMPGSLTSGFLWSRWRGNVPHAQPALRIW